MGRNTTGPGNNSTSLKYCIKYRLSRKKAVNRKCVKQMSLVFFRNRPQYKQCVYTWKNSNNAADEWAVHKQSLIDKAVLRSVQLPADASTDARWCQYLHRHGNSIHIIVIVCSRRTDAGGMTLKQWRQRAAAMAAAALPTGSCFPQSS